MYIAADQQSRRTRQNGAAKSLRSPVVISPMPDADYKRDAKIVMYWAALVGVNAWAFTRDHYYLLNGWWMMLLFFWGTANSVATCDQRARKSRLLEISLVCVAASLFIYGTFGWLTEMLDGLWIGGRASPVRLFTFPVRALIASCLTGIILVPPVRWRLDPNATLLLALSAIPTGLWNYGAGLVNLDRWRTHWLSNCIGLFAAAILPLVVAAITARLGARPARIARVGRRPRIQSLPRWAAGILFLVIYPGTIAIVLGLGRLVNQLSGKAYSNWEYWNLNALAWFLIAIALLTGLKVSWQLLGCSFPPESPSIKWLRGIIFLIASPFILILVSSEGFNVGPGGHPKSPTRGRVKIPHLDAVNWRRSALS